jgi:hypothetical protein
MTTEIYPDTSEHQVPVNDSFNRKFFMFRMANEWGRGGRNYPDADYWANYRWSIANRGPGKKLVNLGFYNIPCVISNDEYMSIVNEQNPVHDCVAMIDMEGWGGLVSGNHSAQLNDLANRLRARQNGRADLVWGYGNRGDLGSIWPSRPSWMGVVVAGYNNNDPRDEIANCAAWQYTNGSENHTSWPSSTPPFGNCDHNALFVPIPTPAPTPPEDDMPLSADDLKQIGALIDHRIARVLQYLCNGGQNAYINGTWDVPASAPFGPAANVFDAMLKNPKTITLNEIMDKGIGLLLYGDSRDAAMGTPGPDGTIPNQTHPFNLYNNREDILAAIAKLPTSIPPLTPEQVEMIVTTMTSVVLAAQPAKFTGSVELTPTQEAPVPEPPPAG